MKRVEFSTKCEIVDEVTEKLKDFNMTYEDLCEFVFDYKEAIEEKNEIDDKIKDIQKEIKSLGVEDLFKEVYLNSDFEVYDE